MQRTTALHAACVALLAAALLGVGLAVAGSTSAAVTPVDAENATYEVGDELRFDVDHAGDGYQLRQDDAFVELYVADGGTVVVDTTDLDPGSYTLEHGDTATVEYAFDLVEPTPTPTPTATPTPTPDPRLEHRYVWPDDYTRSERRAATETTGGFHWVGELLAVDVGDEAFVEVYHDGELVRTLVNDDETAYFPTSDLPPGTYRLEHEDGGWSMTVGLGLQDLDAALDEDGDVTVTSNRREYALTVASDRTDNATVAAAVAEAEYDGDADRALVAEAGRETVLSVDGDELPAGEHVLTLHAADAPVSTTVTVVGTGPTPTPSPEATPTATPEGGETGDDGDGGPAADDGAGLDESTPGFGAVAAMLALLAAIALAVRRE